MPMDVCLVTPFHVALDLVGGGGSILFEWNGKSSAVHFDRARDAAEAAAVLNEYLTDTLDAALRERSAPASAAPLPPSGEPVQ